MIVPVFESLYGFNSLPGVEAFSNKVREGNISEERPAFLVQLRQHATRLAAMQVMAKATIFCRQDVKAQAISAAPSPFILNAGHQHHADYVSAVNCRRKVSKAGVQLVRKIEAGYGCPCKCDTCTEVEWLEGLCVEGYPVSTSHHSEPLKPKISAAASEARQAAAS